jgi:hypothetical protein
MLNCLDPSGRDCISTPNSTTSLRQEILRRDGWRCQRCGARSNLEVHHQEFRSHCSDDCEPNLITLCVTCREEYIGIRNDLQRLRMSCKAQICG